MKIALLIHDIRSCHNVGSLLRSADCFGVEKVVISGYSPYPAVINDERLPHIVSKQTAQIAKTALGAEKTLLISHTHNAQEALKLLRDDGYELVGLEQSPRSVTLESYRPTKAVALIVGREVEGIDDTIMSELNTIVEIPLFGHKESLNVATAAGIALYHIKTSITA